MKRLNGSARLVFSVVLVIGVTVAVAWKLSLLTGFPKGVDAYAHLVKVAWILKHFPQINWNPYWDSGTYFWLWTYPPLGSLVTAIVVMLTGLSAPAAMTLVTLGSFVLFAVSLYWVVRFVTKSALALPITILAVTTPAIWSWWGHGGNYIRLWGLGWWGLAFALFVRYLARTMGPSFIVAEVAPPEWGAGPRLPMPEHSDGGQAASRVSRQHPRPSPPLPGVLSGLLTAFIPSRRVSTAQEAFVRDSGIAGNPSLLSPAIPPRAFDKVLYVLLVLVLGLSMSSHMLFGGLTVVMIGLYVLFAVPGWKQKILILAKTLGVGFLLSGFYYLPILTTTTGNRFIESAYGAPIPWKGFFFIDPKEPFFTLPMLFTIPMLVALVLAVSRLLKPRTEDRLRWAFIPTFFLLLLGSLIYIIIGHIPGYPANGYLAVFAPFAVLPLLITFATFLLAGVIGSAQVCRGAGPATRVSRQHPRPSPAVKGVLSGLLTALMPSRRVSTARVAFVLDSGIAGNPSLASPALYDSPAGLRGFVLIVTVAILAAFFLTDRSKWTVYDVSAPASNQTIARSLIKPLPKDPSYRFGTDSAFVADWWNYVYPDLPQTRDYIYQGIPYKQWQYFQEYVLWTQADRMPESQWLLDWYGIRDFTVGFASINTKEQKFLSRPDLFSLKAGRPDKGFYVFSYRNATPILSTTDAFPVLIFGTQSDYEVVVRGMALAGLGTNRVIPVYGGTSPDRFGSLTPSVFPTVLLYRVPLETIKQNDKWAAYLRTSGRVVVEAAFLNATNEVPSWIPVSNIQSVALDGVWHFDTVDEKQFSPARFGENPWNITTGTPVAGAVVVRSSGGKPVIVSNTVGKGTVIWSGLNLPYHAESYRNEYEAGVLEDLLAIPASPSALGTVQVSVNQPEKREWIVRTKAPGLVWKETYFPNRWKVFWQDALGNKGRLTVFPAGPNLMYVPLPTSFNYPMTIRAGYQVNTVDYLGWMSTIGTAMALVVYLVGKFPKLPVVRIKNPLTKLTSWWEKE